MPRPNAVVASRFSFEPPLEGRNPADVLRSEGLSVRLEDGRRLRLNPGDRRAAGFARILDGLAALKQPAYLEFDPDSETISRLLIPIASHLVALRASPEGGYDVELEHSHAVHRLPAGAEDFAELEKALRNALDGDRPVVVVEEDDHRIIEVADYRPDPEGRPLPRFPGPRRIEEPRRPWFWWLRFWRWCWRCVSRRRAQQIFDAMSATSCDPLTVPPPCIPFMYPDNGCWARAHEMCRLMIAMGVSPRKVWIQGSLKAATRNKPNCFVQWVWHVAPTICVRSWFFWKQEMVIDPSLFTTPVTQATWKGAQGDPSATLTPSDASNFLWGATDPAYTQTNIDLQKHRLLLMNRSIQIGPPPYANCP